MFQLLLLQLTLLVVSFTHWLGLTSIPFQAQGLHFLLCKRCIAHFHADAALQTFTRTLGWTLLCKQWGGHFYANAGVDTFMQTLGWTLSCQRWGGHLSANAGVDTLMQKLGWTLLCKRRGGHFYANVFTQQSSKNKRYSFSAGFAMLPSLLAIPFRA